MITYAQNFEDVMLARIFRGRTDGFYVDVGAGDPVELSVTKWFYELGWSGINIEPSPTFYPKLVAERIRDVNLNCGAGAIEGSAQYFQLSANELSSFDPDVRARAEAAGMQVVPRTVDVLPLTTILDRHSDRRAIDFLKIDVEGWEYEVLSGLDLQRYRPTVIIVEATLPTTRIESHSKWEDLLTRADYAVAHFDGMSRFYLPGERMDLKVNFQLPPNIFDDFKTWQQAASELELSQLREEASHLREEASQLRHDLDQARGVVAVFRDEAGRLSKVLTDGRPEIADPDTPGKRASGADSMTDHDSLDAIRRANWTLSSPGRLSTHALRVSMRSLCRRLPRRDG
jgi:FkbM family methyltransferase